jgi:hypothetical protein
VVADVDRAAFQTKAEAYLRENFSEEQVPVLEAIRSVAASTSASPAASAAP